MIECKGRNGWFSFSEFDTSTGKRFSSVSIYSKTRGNFPPIYIGGSPREIIDLFEDILFELKSGKKS